MYNSVTVTVLAKIWYFLVLGYEHSIFKKIMNSIGRGFKYVGRGSKVVELFTSNGKKVKETYFYHIYCKFIDGIYHILKWLNVKLKKWRDFSFIDKSAVSNFRDEDSIQHSFAIFLLFFGITIFIFNAIRGKFLGNSFRISILIILIALLGIKYDGGYLKLIQNSNTYKFFRSIFTVDKAHEGGEKWW